MAGCLQVAVRVDLGDLEDPEDPEVPEDLEDGGDLPSWVVVAEVRSCHGAVEAVPPRHTAPAFAYLEVEVVPLPLYDAFHTFPRGEGDCRPAVDGGRDGRRGDGTG